MLTGDHLETAVAVAKKCNILSKIEDASAESEEGKTSVACEAKELRAFFDKLCRYEAKTGEIEYLVSKSEWEQEFKPFVQSMKVIARCTPEDKTFFVKLLQKNKARCAVVGDSPADCDALKAATVGICMKTACDIAKDSADIVLLESHFTHIRSTLMWGRNLFRNMQRFLTFQLTVNIVICYITFLGGLIGHPPLNVIQMLWTNLIMDILAAIALGTERWDSSATTAVSSGAIVKEAEAQGITEREEQVQHFRDRDSALAMRVARKDPLVRPFIWQQILIQAAWQCLVLTILMFFGGMMLFPAG